MTNQLIYTLNWRGLKLTLDEVRQIEEATNQAGLKNFVNLLEDPALRMRIHSLEDWLEKGQRELNWIFERGYLFITPQHPNYPKEYLQLRFPPLGLVALGDPTTLNQETLAVVGSRNPSHWTLQWMQDHLSHFIDAERLPIVSGGARGVDQMAHKISIAKSCPKICFLPSGFQKVYPPGFSRLIEYFQNKNSVVVSQFSPFQPIFKSQFSARNELMAVLAKAVFVVEARQKSGSMLTAKLAQFHNKHILTLPFHPGSKIGQGNLDLIFNGALIIRDSRDLIETWQQL